MPPAWSHGTEPEDLIGTIDPMQIEETSQGLVVGGKLDVERSAKARGVARDAQRLDRAELRLPLRRIPATSRGEGPRAGQPRPLRSQPHLGVLSMKAAEMFDEWEKEQLRPPTNAGIWGRVGADEAAEKAEERARQKAARRARPIQIKTFTIE